ncbi:MAG: DUF308 domain-containing protein [Eubacterium sp.]|nr:DUF308 domain-containing protein [Eubacterium sp.]
MEENYTNEQNAQNNYAQNGYAQNGYAQYNYGENPYANSNSGVNPEYGYQGGYGQDNMTVTPPNPSGAALALGIIGLVMALMGGSLFGVIGGGIAVIMGIIAICLGVSAKNKTNRKKGTGGFVLGIISVCFGLIMAMSFLVSGIAIRTVANEEGLPLLAKHGGALTFGVIGMMISISGEGDWDALQRELDSIGRGHIRIRA